MRTLAISLSVLAVACGPGAGQGERPAATPASAPAKPRSVVLISLDTLRADHLGAYGYFRDTSPFIDSLARDGALFENAFTPTTWTLPAHASMLTGLTPFRHGASEDGRRIREDVPTLAELLKTRGYETAAVINGPYVARDFGFDRGFDTFVERYRENRTLDHYQPLVLQTLRSLHEPFFLFVHYISVHSPYRPFPQFNKWAPQNERPAVEAIGLRQFTLDLESGKAKLSAKEREHLVGLYDGEVLTADSQIAELMGVVRNEASKDALLILTSDHGEEFLDHGALHHGRTLYDELIRVPLIVNGPGVKRGVRVAEPVSLSDILPTVLAWVGAPPARDIEGVSLAGVLRGEQPALPANRTLPLHTRAGDSRVHLWGLRTATAKLIVDQKTGKKEFYDLISDPGEKRNLYPTPEALRLERQLETLSLAPSSAEAVGHDKQRLEVLRSLGYR